MVLKVFYSPDYEKHSGFNSSLENPNRIGYLLSKLKATPMEFPQNFRLPMKWEKIIAKLSLNFSKRKRNCPECSFEIESPKDREDPAPERGNRENFTCPMCSQPISKVVSIVSDLKGETTYMCETSTTCVKNLLKGILYTITSLKSQKHLFFLTRPPGHHCDNEEPSGFCLVNNIALFADFFASEGKRVCILDWDVHHGNGTQKIFYSRNDVLFIDIHRGGLYPFTGKEDETGTGKGTGYTLNFPLEKNSGEEEYLKVFSSILPKIEEYRPDIILVSCGFDAHKNDPIGGMKLESSSYRKFHNLLEKLGIRIIYFLEGGYNPEVILESVEAMGNN